VSSVIPTRPNGPAPPARTLRVRAGERRRHRRVPITLGARLLADGTDEAPCRTLDLSCGGALIEATAWPSVDCAVVLYARDLGRVPARVVRHVAERGFGISFEIGPSKRERLAEGLTVKATPAVDGAVLDDPRRAVRRRTDQSAVAVELEDGRRLTCDVLDFSLLGVALRSASLRPPLGAWVKVGATHGRVARFFDDGFAVDFGPRSTISGPIDLGPGFD